MSTVGSDYRDSNIRDQLAGSEIAGGSAYLSTLASSEIPQRSNADFIISSPATAADLWDATNSANDISGGGLVWIDGDVTINMSGESGAISNCTIASDRGQGGSSGALIRMPDHGNNTDAYRGGIGTGMLTVEDNTRFFGIEIRGPSYDYWADRSDSHPGYIPFHWTDSPYGEYTDEERAEFRANWYSRCMTINRSSVEIENCEIWGWSTQGIVIQENANGNAPTPSIHHSDIHDCMQSGYGYNIEAMHGHPSIRYCYLNASRHTIATFGWWDAGFILEDSIIGPDTSLFLLDSHSLAENGSGSSSDRYARDFYGRAGGNIEVRRVTFCPTHVISDADFNAGNSTNHVSFGGEQWPVDGVGTIIENCRMAHESTSEAIYQRTSGSGWSVPAGPDGTTENFIYRNNQYGAPDTTYEPEYGAPLNLRGETPTQTADLLVYTETDGGAPIEDATVALNPAASVDLSDYAGPLTLTTTSQSDPSGVYAAFTGLPVGTYDIEVTAENYQTATYSALNLGTSGREPVVTMTDAEGTSTLGVSVVTGTDQTPVNDATVSLYPTSSTGGGGVAVWDVTVTATDGAGNVRSGVDVSLGTDTGGTETHTTDADGVVTFQRPNGTYDGTVSGPDITDTSFSVTVSDEATATTVSAPPAATGSAAETVEQTIHEEINTYRQNQSLSTLGFSEAIATVARNHSQDMYEQDYFSHTAPDGDGPGDRLDQADITYDSYAENLASQQPASFDPSDQSDLESVANAIVDSWINSSGHQDNIVSDYTREGVGVHIQDGQILATQVFHTGPDPDTSTAEPYYWANRVNANPYDVTNPYVGIQSYSQDSTRPTEADATVSVTTASELFSELDAASSGDIVWLDSNTTFNIDSLGRYQDVPSGVTMASDGARVQLTEPRAAAFELTNDDARVTGVRFEGNYPSGGPDPYDSSEIARGIIIRDSLPQIDNCEFYGWTAAGVFVENASTSEMPLIRNCIFRDNRMAGLGYGAVTYSGMPEFAYCFFNNNRHSIAGDGSDTASYHVHDSVHGPNSKIDCFEQHDPGGSHMIVNNNTFKGVTKNANGNVAPAYTQRGTPADVAEIYNNHIYNDQETDASTPNAAGQSIIQYSHDADTFVNVNPHDNYYGETGAPDSVGVRNPDS